MAKATTYIINIVLFAATTLILGAVRSFAIDIPIAEMAYQEWWIACTAPIFAITVFIILLFKPFRKAIQLTDFYQIVTFAMIYLAGLEAVTGLRQIYGSAMSNHSLYAMTGSFFNPGPYSGYLAMVFPLCLHEWLRLKEITDRNRLQQVGYYFSLMVLVLIICILPAGMSRSAWLAVILSGCWVYGMHTRLGEQLRMAWRQHKTKMLVVMSVAAVCVVILGVSLFHLKKDSADGRLFMWKISCLAIAERPLTGYGTGHFAEGYGKAQENYFAQGAYSEQEELVAGSPEYAFNEYLQVAIEWGVPALIGILACIGFSIWRGVKLKHIGICGAILSLMVFAFSSYPMQIPAFEMALVFLLAAAVITRPWQLVFFALLIGGWGAYLWKTNVYEECKEWNHVKMLYNSNAYEEATQGYEKLYPSLKNRGTFLFEYGHSLHKQKEYEASNMILQEATTRSCDPMILNIIGKNYQGLGQYDEAEKWLIRSTHLLPGRIYPYYLLAKLYAEPAYHQPEKLKEAASTVFTKEPKVQSTAVREMREEIRKLLPTK